MSNHQDYNNIGNDIRTALDEALRTMDFTKLNENISDTVNGAFDEMRLQLDKATTDFLENATRSVTRTKKSFENKKKLPREVNASKQEIVPYKVAQKPVGKVSSVLYTVFGGIGTGVTGILSLVFGLLAIATEGAVGVLGFGIAAFILLISLGLLGTGCIQRERLNRFKRYMRVCGSKTYCDIKQLAAHIGRNTRYVVRDLKKMIKMGMLPEGHLDDKGTCLMLDDKTFNQYLETKQAYAHNVPSKVAVLPENTDAEDKSGNEAILNDNASELQAMINEGQEYIRKLRELNDVIPGEAISDKLYRLEKVIAEIFDALKRHPEKKPQMRKFMDYYLPTTLKLVQTYAEFDGVQIQGENIVTAKQEIEKTIDTINKAFEKLLDDLFMDDAFDVTTDAQVLQTLLAQEGLAEDENFKQAGK